MSRSKAIAILGSTGSIGCNTLQVIGRDPGMRVVALSANTNIALLAEQCREFQPRYAVVADPGRAGELRERLRASGRDRSHASGGDRSHASGGDRSHASGRDRRCASDAPTKVLSGAESLVRIASLPEIDTVMAAIVGGAGLESTLSAIRAGKKVLLANKESLVMAGDLCMESARSAGALLIPVDSEHNAIFQCLPYCDTALAPAQTRHVRKLVLTCSGGPFLHTPAREFAAITPEQARSHPKWDMGAKISVDSATLMNKGLEVIEACYLFGMEPDRVEVLIHPQSIVHSMVHFEDGSVLAQMGTPDMKIPIACALAWPERMSSGADVLNLAGEEPLEFLPPDLERFPCLGLGLDAARQRGLRPAVLNAANEVAVQAFLEGKLPFSHIAGLIEAVSAKIPCGEADSLAIILEVDGLARAYAKELIHKRI